MKAWDDRGCAVRLKFSLLSKVDASSPPTKIGAEQIKRSDFFERRIAVELLATVILILAACVVLYPYAGGFTILLTLGSLLAALWRAAARSEQVSNIHYMLAAPMCPACHHLLTGVPAQADGCTVCPECGAAWRLPS